MRSWSEFQRLLFKLLRSTIDLTLITSCIPVALLASLSASARSAQKRSAGTLSVRSSCSLILTSRSKKSPADQVLPTINGLRSPVGKHSVELPPNTDSLYEESDLPDDVLGTGSVRLLARELASRVPSTDGRKPYSPLTEFKLRPRLVDWCPRRTQSTGLRTSTAGVRRRMARRNNKILLRNDNRPGGFANRCPYRGTLMPWQERR